MQSLDSTLLKCSYDSSRFLFLSLQGPKIALPYLPVFATLVTLIADDINAQEGSGKWLEYPHLTRLYWPDCPIRRRRRRPNKDENFDSITDLSSVWFTWIWVTVAQLSWTLDGREQFQSQIFTNFISVAFSQSLACFKTWGLGVQGRLKGLDPRSGWGFKAHKRLNWSLSLPHLTSTPQIFSSFKIFADRFLLKEFKQIIQFDVVAYSSVRCRCSGWGPFCRFPSWVPFYHLTPFLNLSPPKSPLAPVSPSQLLCKSPPFQIHFLLLKGLTFIALPVFATPLQLPARISQLCTIFDFYLSVVFRDKCKITNMKHTAGNSATHLTISHRYALCPVSPGNQLGFCICLLTNANQLSWAINSPTTQLLNSPPRVSHSCAVSPGVDRPLSCICSICICICICICKHSRVIPRQLPAPRISQLCRLPRCRQPTELTGPPSRAELHN